MRKLVSTRNMDKKEWLKWRTMGIGGSDASVIAGVNPYRSVFQLWKEKRDRKNRRKRTMNIRTLEASWNL